MTVTDIVDHTPTPTTPPPRLPNFEGRPVARSVVKLTKAGDGLSDACKVAPLALEIGTTVTFVGTATVRKVDHTPDGKDDDAELVREHVLDCANLALVVGGDETLVLAMVTDNRARVEAALAEIQAAEDAEGTIFDTEHGAAAAQAAADALASTDAEWEDPYPVDADPDPDDE